MIISLARAVVTALVLAPLTVLSQSKRPANATPVQTDKVGTVVIAHGGDSLWNALVVNAARQARTGGPVEVSFLMGPAAKTTRFQDAVKRLETSGVSRIVVVPMLVSSHSGHFEQIRYLAGDSVTLDSRMMHHLHMSGIERPVTRGPIRLARALDDAPEMARVLADRALAMTNEPDKRALLIVGHGPNSAEDYRCGCRTCGSLQIR